MSGRTIETTLDIGAPTSRVWQELTDFARFAEWSKFILGIEGELSPGAQLAVRLDDGGGPMTMRPEVLVSDTQAELRWLGKVGASFVFAGEHYFKLAPLPNGGTRLTHGEIFRGILTPLFWGKLNTRTRRAFGEFNEALRVRAETAAAPSA